jgi:superfamily II DNA or RNA helicase
MSDYNISKINEAYVKINCDKGFARELSEYFTFYVPNYQFSPQFKKKLWDGKIRLLDLRNQALYHGLVPYVKKFCDDRGYSLSLDDDVILTDNISLVEAEQFIETLKLPYEVRDYQLKAFVHAIRNKRILILSPTGSGKSLIIYMIIRYLQSTGSKKGLLVVPTTSLVEQMNSDFKGYGYDVDKYCHRQYAGKEKDTSHFLIITTWQSIYNREPEYFEQFDFVSGDESHLFKAKSLSSIMSGLINAEYRIGTTGTLDGTQTHKLVLEGLFGPVYQTTTTKELMDNNHLSTLKIKCLILKYPKDVCKLSKKWEYKDEINYLVANTARNQFIKNLALSLTGNTLVLFQLVEKHGKFLYEIIRDGAHKKRKTFFVYAKTDVEEREAIRAITEREKDAIIVASYGTFSTGINIQNLHNVIFASPSKSKIRNLQSIGRGLRKGDDKDSATLFDISDDFRIDSHVNTTLKHFTERVKIYDSEKFDYTFYNIELMKNGQN